MRQGGDLVGGRRAGAVVLGVVVLAAAGEAAALPQMKVRATRAYEKNPAATRGALAWGQAPRSRPNAFAVFARRGGQRFHVSRPGRLAGVWAGAWNAGKLVYSELSGGASNLWFFNPATRRRARPPQGVNTSLSENGASRSGRWLLFRRTNFGTSTERIILFNLATHRQRLLAKTVGRRYAQPGTVAGDYATFFRCPGPRTCRGFRHHIPSNTTIAVPNPFRASQFAVSVTRNGAVYLAESSNVFCGAGRRLVRYFGGGRRVLLVFGPRQDPALTSPVVNPNGSTAVFYDRFNCRTDASDLYKVVIPPP
jgi:hypothetical protein